MARGTTWYRPFTPKCVGIIQEKLGIELTEEQISKGEVQFIHKSRWSFIGQGLVSIKRADLGPLGGPPNQITLTIKQPRFGMNIEELKMNPQTGMNVLFKRGSIQNLARLLDELLNW